MNKILFSSLLSLSLVATPAIQALCPLRCDNYKAATTVGGTITLSGVTFLTAAFIQYKKEQKLATADAIVDSNEKYFFTDEQLVEAKTSFKKFGASTKDFLKFVATIYVNAHRPTTYAATFEAYPKLTFLALGCTLASFLSGIKAFVDYKAYKATALEDTKNAKNLILEAEQVAQNDAIQEEANKKTKDTDKTEALKLQQEETNKKIADDALKLQQQKHARETSVALALSGQITEHEQKVKQIETDLQTMNNGQEKNELIQLKEIKRAEIQKLAAAQKIEIERLCLATAEAKKKLDAADFILNVDDTRLLDKDGKVTTKDGKKLSVKTCGAKTLYKERSAPEYSKKDKIAPAKNAYESALAAFNKAQKEYDTCVAAEQVAKRPTQKIPVQATTTKPASKK